MTCHGAGNGKPAGARRVQFAMGLFGKTQEKPPKELVRAAAAAPEWVRLRGGAVELVNDWTLFPRGWPGAAQPPFPGPPTRSRGRRKSFKEAAVGKENPGVPFPQGGRGPGEGVPRSRLGERRQQRRAASGTPAPARVGTSRAEPFTGRPRPLQADCGRRAGRQGP